MATDTTEPSDLFSRLVVPMTPAAAESVLSWGFTDQAVETMNELAAKARQGTLTADEQAAVDMYERTNNVLGILKSRARQLLSASSDSSTS
jgi:hypothetical protein